MKKLKLPLKKQDIKKLSRGKEISLTGVIYTARDQAHKQLVEAIKKGQRLPVDLRGGVIYYCGPAKTPRGKIIGSCGPTTSSRMDEFTPALLRYGLSGMIGKGSRSEAVVKAIKKFQAVYFLTYAGCGALLSKYVKSSRPVAYRNLGPEAIYRLEVEDFPVIVEIK